MLLSWIMSRPIRITAFESPLQEHQEAARGWRITAERTQEPRTHLDRRLVSMEIALSLWFDTDDSWKVKTCPSTCATVPTDRGHQARHARIRVRTAHASGPAHAVDTPARGLPGNGQPASESHQREAIPGGFFYPQRFCRREGARLSAP